jgi:hypothetical protein
MAVPPWGELSKFLLFIRVQCSLIPFYTSNRMFHIHQLTAKTLGTVEWTAPRRILFRSDYIPAWVPGWTIPSKSLSVSWNWMIISGIPVCVWSICRQKGLNAGLGCCCTHHFNSCLEDKCQRILSCFCDLSFLLEKWTADLGQNYLASLT